MCQAYGMTAREVSVLPFPQFNLYLLCMYNYIALQHGVDPDAPAEGVKPEGKVLKGAAALQRLREFEEERKRKSQREEAGNAIAR